jgi:hypothetical protein
MLDGRFVNVTPFDEIIKGAKTTLLRQSETPVPEKEKEGIPNHLSLQGN